MKTAPRRFSFIWVLLMAGLVLAASSSAHAHQRSGFGAEPRIAPRLWCVGQLEILWLSIALPDGKLHRFEAYLSQECAFGQVPPPPLTVLFRPLGQTTSKLEIVNHPYVEARGGQLFDWDNLETFNPTEFKLTTEENYAFYLREGVGIERIVDPFNNTLTYTANGLIHSNGRSIAFTKDAAGRITAITDPSGKQIRYAYDANGDLVAYSAHVGPRFRAMAGQQSA